MQHVYNIPECNLLPYSVSEHTEFFLYKTLTFIISFIYIFLSAYYMTASVFILGSYLQINLKITPAESVF